VFDLGTWPVAVVGGILTPVAVETTDGVWRTAEVDPKLTKAAIVIATKSIIVVSTVSMP